MSYEAATSIATLVAANPPDGDLVNQAAEHIRMLKAVLQAQFPNLTTAITATSQQLNSFVPIGTIVAFAPAAGSIPSGWTACVGGTINRSDTGASIAIPDLRDKFVVGGGGSLSAGATFANPGGVGTNTITGSLAGDHNHVGVTDSQGSHNHTGSTAGYALTVNDIPSHGHGIPLGLYTITNVPAGGTQWASFISGDQHQNGTTSVSGGGGAHQHGISSDGAHTHNLSINNAGAHQHTVAVPPPSYYALIHIMKY